MHCKDAIKLLEKMKRSKHTRQLNIRVDSVTYRKLNELAKKTDSRVSNVVRTMITNCFDILEKERS